LIVEKTMQLSKKQKTWFKRDQEINWLPADAPEGAAVERLSRFLDSLG
jgi:tRNA A37 N6-isopentenylltransferase MiaA